MGEGRVSGPSNAKGSAREMRAPGDASVRDGLRRTEQWSAGIEELSVRSERGLCALQDLDQLAGQVNASAKLTVVERTAGLDELMDHQDLLSEKRDPAPQPVHRKVVWVVREPLPL